MEEYDYMSEDFLSSCLKNDVRPGLVHRRTDLRKNYIEKKKDLMIATQKNTGPKALAASQLNKGLETALGPENKGFSMMEKMGFKPGTSLGASQSGITEPLPLLIKHDRKGLGRNEALKDILMKKKVFRERQSKSLKVDDFRAGMSRKFKDRYAESDLFKSQKACYRFDSECDIDTPEELWFWPQHLRPGNEESSDIEEDDNESEVGNDFSTGEKLELVTVYLRKTYLYCIWCGLQFDDEKDLNSTCPGPSRDDH